MKWFQISGCDNLSTIWYKHQTQPLQEGDRNPWVSTCLSSFIYKPSTEKSIIWQIMKKIVISGLWFKNSTTSISSCHLAIYILRNYLENCSATTACGWLIILSYTLPRLKKAEHENFWSFSTLFKVYVRQNHCTHNIVLPVFSKNEGFSKK